MKHLDMKGQPCPIPVVQARKALRLGENMVLVEVDNEVAVQNLRKMAEGEGHGFGVEEVGQGCFQVTLRAGEGVGSAGGKEAGITKAGTIEDTSGGLAAKGGGVTLAIGRQCMGDGAEELGAMLMKGFIFAQSELAEPPRDMIFFNGGAKLTTEGASTLPDLQTLAARGVRIWTCGTCLNFYGLTDKLAVGQVTNMMHIAQMLQSAGHLVSL